MYSVGVDEYEELQQDFIKNPEDWIQSCAEKCPCCKELLCIHIGGNGIICKNGCFRESQN